MSPEYGALPQGGRACPPTFIFDFMHHQSWPRNPIGSFCSLYQREPTTSGINQRPMAQRGYHPFRKQEGSSSSEHWLIWLVLFLCDSPDNHHSWLVFTGSKRKCHQAVYPREFTRVFVCLWRYRRQNRLGDLSLPDISVQLNFLLNGAKWPPGIIKVGSW